MNIRLVAFDLDGTALREDKTVSPRTEAALREAARRGCAIVPASGRVLKTVPRQVLSLPGVRWCVTANGATVVDLKDRLPVYTDWMTREQTDRILALLCPTGCLVEAYAESDSYAGRAALDGMLRLHPPEWLTRLTLETQTFVDDLQGYVKEHRFCIEKINMPFLPRELRDGLAEKLGGFPEYSVCSAFDTNLEVNTASCSKGEALRHLCETLAIAPEEVMTIGDGGNDVAMLRFAGLGVAMKNASAAALEAADRVTAANTEDGVALAIENWVLR